MKMTVYCVVELGEDRLTESRGRGRLGVADVGAGLWLSCCALSLSLLQALALGTTPAATFLAPRVFQKKSLA